MSGKPKVFEPVQQVEVRSTGRPTDVPFPSVKDLKAKFAVANAVDAKQVTISKYEQQKRHSYARGNSKLEITGPNSSGTASKQTSKTPTTIITTAVAPTTLKVKTTNGIGPKENGTSPVTTPTSPVKSYQPMQRSSVILHLQAGIGTQQEAVTVRKKADIETDSDSVRRLTSQFNDMRHQTTTTTTTIVTSAKINNEVESRSVIEKEVDIVETRIEDNATAKYEEEEQQHSYQEYESSNRTTVEEDALQNSYERERKMSTPSAEFLKSMSETDTIDKTELELSEDIETTVNHHHYDNEADDIAVEEEKEVVHEHHNHNGEDEHVEDELEEHLEEVLHDYQEELGEHREEADERREEADEREKEADERREEAFEQREEIGEHIEEAFKHQHHQDQTDDDPTDHYTLIDHEHVLQSEIKAEVAEEVNQILSDDGNNLNEVEGDKLDENPIAHHEVED